MLGGTLVLSGCTKDRNDSVMLGEVVRMEAISPPTAGYVLSDQDASVTQIDRSAWELTWVLVPVDGTAHFPTYVRYKRKVTETSRQRGEYPTDQSSLDLAEGMEDQAWEAMTQPFRALGNAILIVPRMIYKRPWKMRESPRDYYARHWLVGGEAAVVTGTEPDGPPVPDAPPVIELPPETNPPPVTDPPVTGSP